MSKQRANDLRAARALIELGWCKKVYARLANGHSCQPEDPDAARFCMVGAVIAAIPGSARRQEDACDSLHSAVGIDTDLGLFNDAHRNKAAILAAFDAAIAAEEAAE